MDQRNCVAPQDARADDASVTKVSARSGGQQGEQTELQPRGPFGRLAARFVPTGAGVTKSPVLGVRQEDPA